MDVLSYTPRPTSFELQQTNPDKPENQDNSSKDVPKTSDNNDNPTSNDCPPDKGLQAWLVVLGSFLMHLALLGVMYAGGVFVLPYTKEFGVGRGTVAWFVSLAMISWFLSGGFTGHLGDIYGVRRTTVGGTFLYVLLLELASLSPNIWVTFLLHGLGMGIVFSIVYFPAIAVVSQWFLKRRGLATGIAVAGSGVGNFTFPPVLQLLVTKYGWRVALRILGLVGGALLLVSAALMRPRVARVGAHHKRNWGMLRNRDFALLAASVMLLNFPYSVPVVHIVPYGVDKGLTKGQASVMLALIGACSAVGRFLIGLISDRMGRLETMRTCFLIMSITVALWPLCTNLWSITLFACCFGTTAGSFIATIPVVLADKFGVDRLSSNYGLIMTFVAISGVSSPMVGLAYDQTGSYTIAIEVVAFLGVVSFVLLLFVSKDTAIDEPQPDCSKQEPTIVVVDDAAHHKPALWGNDENL